MWDIIPDIHGQADKLEGLLKLLGYREVKEVWRHSDSERSAIFLGDFIDRGPENAKVIRIVRSMINAGTAQAIMGNHELNAIHFHTNRRSFLGCGRGGSAGQPVEKVRHASKAFRAEGAGLHRTAGWTSQWLIRARSVVRRPQTAVSVRCASPNGADFDGLVSTIDSGHLGALYGCEAEEAALAG